MITTISWNAFYSEKEKDWLLFFNNQYQLQHQHHPRNHQIHIHRNHNHRNFRRIRRGRVRAQVRVRRRTNKESRNSHNMACGGSKIWDTAHM